MIYRMDMALNPGQMALNIKEDTKVARNLARGRFILMMVAFMRESLRTILFTEAEYLCGQMEEFMKDNGRITPCLEK